VGETSANNKYRQKIYFICLTLAFLGQKQSASEHIAEPFQKLFELNVYFVLILIKFYTYSNNSQSL